MTSGLQVRHDGWWQLPTTARAAGTARGHLRASLADAFAPDDVDVAVLLVSELDTNAVLHGPPGVVGLRLTWLTTGVRIGVEDTGPGPVLDAAGPWSADEEGGRGLRLVRAMAAACGCDPREDGPGTCVWFLLTPSAALAGAGAVPRAGS